MNATIIRLCCRRAESQNAVESELLIFRGNVRGTVRKFHQTWGGGQGRRKLCSSVSCSRQNTFDMRPRRSALRTRQLSATPSGWHSHFNDGVDFLVVNDSSTSLSTTTTSAAQLILPTTSRTSSDVVAGSCLVWRPHIIRTVRTRLCDAYRNSGREAFLRDAALHPAPSGIKMH